MNRRFLLVSICLLVVVVAVPAGAVTRYVPQNYPTIQAAVDACNSGDIVQVAAGTYTDVVHQPGNGDTTRCAVIMKSGITLRGAGPGQTIINADSLGRGIHCRRVTNTTIRDLTVRRAFAPVHGAAILMTDTSSVSIFNCEITNCYDGGVIYLKSSSGTLNLCTITNCLSKQGGGVAIEDHSNPTVSNCTINNNAAPVAGGLFVSVESAPRIENCTIASDSLNSPNGAGGGVHVTNSSPYFLNTKILNNKGKGVGGGIGIVDNSVVTMKGCIVQGNTTEASYGPGGGVYLEFATLTMEDCVVARNSIAGSGSDGAGIYAFFANGLTMNRVTVAANANNSGQTGAAGGIAVWFSSPTIDKTIIAFNNPGAAMACLDGSDNPVVSCSDIYGNQGGNTICGTNGGHNFSLDPLFCDLANSNFRLQMTSPCYPGHHPDGARTCGGDRIGGLDPGCNPAGTDDDVAVPAETRLIRNLPNPFHPPTTIEYELAQPGRVTLRVFDVAGRQIRTLAQGPLPAGRFTAVWDGRNETGEALPSGVYFYRLSVDGKQATRSMVLTR